MLNKILCIIMLGFVVSLASADAQNAPSAVAKVKGKILAVRVQGHVESITKIDGTVKVLRDGDVIYEGSKIVTAAGANVILSFSNGAEVNLAGDSTLDIDEFEQDPFAGDVKVSDMTTEPGNGTSTTKLNLTKGELVGKVVHLNVDRGSEFTVQTPVGAAGIRGTTFRIVFRPGPDGTVRFTVTTSDGRVVFKGITTAAVSIPAGKQVVVTFDVNAGVATTPMVVTNTPPAEAADILLAAQAIVDAVVNTNLSGGGGGGTGGGGGGGNGNDNTQSPPAIPPTQTTTQAGGP
jgi:hypothetical protein